jgi:hypothetical protein
VLGDGTELTGVMPPLKAELLGHWRHLESTVTFHARPQHAITTNSQRAVVVTGEGFLGLHMPDSSPPASGVWAAPSDWLPALAPNSAKETAR